MLSFCVSQQLVKNIAFSHARTNSSLFEHRTKYWLCSSRTVYKHHRQPHIEHIPHQAYSILLATSNRWDCTRLPRSRFASNHNIVASISMSFLNPTARKSLELKPRLVRFFHRHNISKLYIQQRAMQTKAYSINIYLDRERKMSLVAWVLFSIKAQSGCLVAHCMCISPNPLREHTDIGRRFVRMVWDDVWLCMALNLGHMDFG